MSSMQRLTQFAVVVAIVSLSCSASLGQQKWGKLTGQFVLDGTAPKPSAVNVNKDEQVCGKHNLVDEGLTVHAESNGIYGIILYVDVPRGSKAPTPHPNYAQTATADVNIDNLNCRFEPHVVLLRTTQKLVVGNKDPVGHNTRIDTVKNPPINPIIPANGNISQNFKLEERLPSRVTCSIHPWMYAFVVVKESPYMAVSDANGNFEIADVPAGKIAFQVWHEKSGYVDKATVGGQEQKWAKGRMEVEIKEGGTDLGQIKVPLAVFMKK